MQEFMYVMTAVANHHKQGSKKELDFEHSGLLSYLFGKDREKQIFLADFHTIHELLITELLQVQYQEAFDRENKAGLLLLIY